MVTHTGEMQWIHGVVCTLTASIQNDNDPKISRAQINIFTTKSLRVRIISLCNRKCNRDTQIQSTPGTAPLEYTGSYVDRFHIL